MLARNSLARAIRGSNSIEGYNVTVDDAIAAVEGEPPLDAAAETWEAIIGYREAMTYILQLVDDPHFSYSAGFIRGLHYMLLKYDLPKHPGRWRLGPIYVHNDERDERVYEGPPAELIPELVEELITELNRPQDDVPCILRAAMAHLNLVMIHPFADGNGRMARCLQALVIARDGNREPTFCSIEEYLGQNVAAYYQALAVAGGGAWNPERDTRPWVRFCLTAYYRQAMTELHRTTQLHEIWNAVETETAKRHLPERVIAPLVDASMRRRLRNGSYRKLTDVSDAMASKDLKLLVDEGLLQPFGERRGRFYRASERLMGVVEGIKKPMHVEDPFEEPGQTLPLPLPGM